MGATGTSDAGEIDNRDMEVIGFDGYNFVFTGNVTQTLRGSRVDVINIPTVMIIGKRHGSDWVYSRPPNSQNSFRGGRGVHGQ
jgi:hypothetical protein